MDPISAQQRAMWRRMLSTDDLTVYVAERADVVIATASMLVMPNLTYDCQPTAFIEPVIVRRGHRRRGVGHALLERALADARTAGCYKVQIVSHKRHALDGALAFYAAHGFVAEAEGLRLYLDNP